MNQQNIRNFSIIAHIDHGKSTLADRMLELTGTIDKRKMQDQVLDSMELERERGITIKMQPVRMKYVLPPLTKGRVGEGSDTTLGKIPPPDPLLGKEGEPQSEYVLNLIDTPGHIDFSYEVSRALKAVEGSILLVDATQGVQAQTFTTLDMARKQGLVIIPVLSKVDSVAARVDEIKLELAELLDCDPDSVLETSGKTGEGVEDLLAEVIKQIPAPKSEETTKPTALIFDFQYSNHQGIIVYVRVFDGSFAKRDNLSFAIAGKNFQALEVGMLAPGAVETDILAAGEIGYIVTGIKQADIVSVGDTVTSTKNPANELPGYQKPTPVVWASVFPRVRMILMNYGWP